MVQTSVGSVWYVLGTAVRVKEKSVEIKRSRGGMDEGWVGKGIYYISMLQVNKWISRL